jgi:hypothetical protein
MLVTVSGVRESIASTFGRGDRHSVPGTGRGSRIAVTVGTFAVAALAFAAPAQAADGSLLIDGHPYPSSAGCVTVRTLPVRLRIVNESAVRARVYLLPGCKGGVTKTIDAGRKAVPIGASVYIG